MARATTSDAALAGPAGVNPRLAVGAPVLSGDSPRAAGESGHVAFDANLFGYGSPDSAGVIPPLPFFDPAPLPPLPFGPDGLPPQPLSDRGLTGAQPPACPLIIKVGPGLRHRAKTKVIYGRPVCS